MTASSARIVGTGMSVPERVMTNEDFARLVETSGEWILQRTGMRERRIAEHDQATSDLAVEAGRQALADAGLAPEDVDLVICATITPDNVLPATACWVQDRLGCKRAAAYDLTAACCGNIYALAQARANILAGQAKNVLVVAAETLSKITDYEDRSSCVLFGDGAGAAVVQASDEPDTGILYTTLYADGSGGEMMLLPAGGSRRPASHETVESRGHYMQIRGREVFRFAVVKMQELIEECLKACRLTAADVCLVVPHQVNTRIIDASTSRMGFPPEKVFLNIEKYGNTGGASCAMAYHEAREQGLLGPGDVAILVAFGGGLTWAAAVVKH
ncbi:MAG: beta-ketoacyl-ACP synthase III [Phycisphaerae bacterium]|nr:beta-ketoacyl-ACP synthase III [Phycisphaerae bacterium]